MTYLTCYKKYVPISDIPNSVLYNQFSLNLFFHTAGIAFLRDKTVIN